ncbi:MAG: DotU family type IV/VI secretion system protein, partial [Gemmataceae bacterium]|nr:DotU family type IV/VI secretion system protein [Gemmataceae bacterium]
MGEDIVSEVYPVLRLALAYRSMLQQGKPLSVEAVQAELRGKLRVAGSRNDEGEGYLGIRYAVVCWLDELFIIDSPWQADWSARALEPALYQTRSRAHDFWEQSRRASSRSDRAALEAFYLCLLLGFRGELRDNPRELAEVRKQLETQIGLRGRMRWPDEPPEQPVPGTDVPLLSARERLR